MSAGPGEAQERAPVPRLPGAQERLRCSGRGNLTRFDVTRNRRTRDYWHVGPGGEPEVDVDPATDPTGADSP